MLQAVRIGVLTGGGDCPGLNAVIRAIVRKGIDRYGHAIVGYRDGWRWPLENAFTELTIESTRGILPRGGTILGSSRTNPLSRENGAELIRENMASIHLDGLIAIGGEDTLGAAHRLSESGVNVIGVPKTDACEWRSGPSSPICAVYMSFRDRTRLQCLSIKLRRFPWNR